MHGHLSAAERKRAFLTVGAKWRGLGRVKFKTGEVGDSSARADESHWSVSRHAQCRPLLGQATRTSRVAGRALCRNDGHAAWARFVETQRIIA